MVQKTRPIVLSVEQALSMSYATLRFAQLGWRVIRIEPTPVEGRRAHGDPNRHIGRPVADGDRHSYFVGPNVGKEAIALNLKEPDGRALLRRLVRDLDADVFCTNTMPARHTALGLDYATLSDGRPDLVWCCISAMGLAYPDVPGYDPVLQALCGYMDITGPADGHVDEAICGGVRVGRDELPVLVAGAAQLGAGASHVEHRKEGEQPAHGDLCHGHVDGASFSGPRPLEQRE